MGSSREGSLEEVDWGFLTGSSWKGGCFKLVEWHKDSSGERKHSKQLQETGRLEWENGEAGG